MRRARAAAGAALAADIAAVLVFTALGRRNHHDGVTLAGMAETSWPFLVGAVAGWLVSRGWRRPTAIRTGTTVWLCTVAFGMLLRRVTSAGTALSFVLVATVVTGSLILGWRAALALVRARGRRRRADCRRSRSGS